MKKNFVSLLVLFVLLLITVGSVFSQSAKKSAEYPVYHMSYTITWEHDGKNYRSGKKTFRDKENKGQARAKLDAS